MQCRTLLKRILGVTTSTNNDINYQELKCPNLISKMTESQYRFFLGEDESVIESTIENGKI